MEELKYLVKKVDEISDDLSEMKVTQAGQAKDLTYHIKRTDLLEEHLILIRNELRSNTEFKNKAEGAFKLIGVISTGIGLMIGAGKLIMELL